MNVAKNLIFHNKLPRIIVISKRSANLWNKDWMPGPYPKTPEERAAAAKKYNLLPEEYEPSDFMGDYPKLPNISGSTKDPNYNYDIPSIKKDYGEPMHEYANMIGEDRWDINHWEKQQIPEYKQVLYFFLSFGLFAVPFWFFWDKKVELPHMKRHLLLDGPHYKYPWEVKVDVIRLKPIS